MIRLYNPNSSIRSSCVSPIKQSEVCGEKRENVDKMAVLLGFLAIIIE